MHKSRKREDNIPHNRRAEHARPLPLPPAGDVEYPEHRKRRREISRRAATSARFASPHIDGQGGLGDVDCAAYRNTATSADNTEDTDAESIPREQHAEGSRLQFVRNLDRSDSCQGSASSQARQHRRLPSHDRKEDPPGEQGEEEGGEEIEESDEQDNDDEGSGVEEGREGRREMEQRQSVGAGARTGTGTGTEEREIDLTEVMEEEETEALEALEAFEAEIEAEAEELETGSRRRRKRARRTEGAPLRPKSAFMCFLSDYRQQHADEVSRMRVADVARHAGQAWRQLDLERRREYDRRSAESKARYALEREAYDESRGKPKIERLPGQPSRPKGAFLYYLEHFKDERRKQHPESKLAAKVLSQLASEEWKRLTDEQRQPYVEMSQAGKEEYHNWKMAQEAAVAAQRAKVLVPTESEKAVLASSQPPITLPQSQPAQIVPGHPLPSPQAQALELLQQVLRMPSQPAVGSPGGVQQAVLSGLILPSDSLSAAPVAAQVEGQLLQGRPLAEMEGRVAEKAEFLVTSYMPFGSPVSPARATGIGRLLPAPPLAVDLQEQESFSARIRAQIEAQLSSLQQIIALPTPPQLPSLQPFAPETATAALQMVGSPQPQAQAQPQAPPLAATHPSERGRAGYTVTGQVQSSTPLELARQQLETAERLHRLVYPSATGQQVRPFAPFHAAQALPFGAPLGLPPPQLPTIPTTPWSWEDFITDFQRRQFVLLQTLRDIEGAQRSQQESRGRSPPEGPPAAGD